MYNNSYDLPEIRIDNSELKFSGTDEGYIKKTDIVFSRVIFRANYDKLYNKTLVEKILEGRDDRDINFENLGEDQRKPHELNFDDIC